KHGRTVVCAHEQILGCLPWYSHGLETQAFSPPLSLLLIPFASWYPRFGFQGGLVGELVEEVGDLLSVDGRGDGGADRAGVEVQVGQDLGGINVVIRDERDDGDDHSAG